MPNELSLAWTHNFTEHFNSLRGKELSKEKVRMKGALEFFPILTYLCIFAELVALD